MDTQTAIKILHAKRIAAIDRKNAALALKEAHPHSAIIAQRCGREIMESERIIEACDIRLSRLEGNSNG